MVYINYWHLATPPYSENIILLPTLIKNKNKELLSLKKQYKLYLNDLEDKHNAEIFPQENYVPINANSYDILTSIKECIKLINGKKERKTKEQVLFDQIDSNGYSQFIESRFSKFFLKKIKNNII